MSEFEEQPTDDWMSNPTPPPSAGTSRSMKETEADRRVKEDVVRKSGDQLLDFIERAEGHEIEKKQAADRIKAVIAEVSAAGFNAKVVKRIIADRKRDAKEVREEEDLLRVYREAIGI